MAISVEEIINAVIQIEKRTKELSVMLQNENEKITQTMNVVQNTFGDQPTGQDIVRLLNDAMHKGITVDGTVALIVEKLQRYSLNLQK